MAKKRTIELILKGKDILSPVLKGAKKRVSGFVSGTISNLGRLKNSIFSISNAMLGAVTGVAANLVFSPAIKMEAFNTQWSVLLGGLSEGKARMEELTNFAATTPFQLGDVTKASMTLETLTQGALSTGEGLRMVGDVAAGANQPIADLSVWFGRLYDGIQSGRPVGEAMARLQEMGVISGETRGQIEEMTKAGADSSEIWKVVTDAVGKYNGMMEKMSQTTAGKLSTLKDNFNLALGDIAEDMLPAVNMAMDDLLATIEELKADGTLERWGQEGAAVLSSLIENIKTIVGFIRNNSEALKTVGFNAIGLALITKVTKGLFNAKKSLQAYQTAASNAQATKALNSTAVATTKLAGATSKLMGLAGTGMLLATVGIAAYQLGGYLRGLIPAFRKADEEAGKWEKRLKSVNEQLEIQNKKLQNQARSTMKDVFMKAGTTNKHGLDEVGRQKYEIAERAMGKEDFEGLRRTSQHQIDEKRVSDFYSGTLFDHGGFVNPKFGPDHITKKAMDNLGKGKVRSLREAAEETSAKEKADKNAKLQAQWEKDQAAAKKAEYNRTHLSDKEIKSLSPKALAKQKSDELRQKLEFEMKEIKVKMINGEKLNDRESQIVTAYREVMADENAKANAEFKKQQEARRKAQGDQNKAIDNLADYMRQLAENQQQRELEKLNEALAKAGNKVDSLTAALNNQKGKVSDKRNKALMSTAEVKREEREKEKADRVKRREEEKLWERAKVGFRNKRLGSTVTSKQQYAMDYVTERIKERKLAAKKKKEEKKQKELQNQHAKKEAAIAEAKDENRQADEKAKKRSLQKNVKNANAKAKELGSKTKESRKKGKDAVEEVKRKTGERFGKLGNEKKEVIKVEQKKESQKSLDDVYTKLDEIKKAIPSNVWEKAKGGS